MLNFFIEIEPFFSSFFKDKNDIKGKNTNTWEFTNIEKHAISSFIWLWLAQNDPKTLWPWVKVADFDHEVLFS